MLLEHNERTPNPVWGIKAFTKEEALKGTSKR